MDDSRPLIPTDSEVRPWYRIRVWIIALVTVLCVLGAVIPIAVVFGDRGSNSTVITGEVLFFSGKQSRTTCSRLARKYDLSNSEWDRLLDIPLPGFTYPHAIAVGPLVYVAGLYFGDKIVSNICIYDTYNNSWVNNTCYKTPAEIASLFSVYTKSLSINGKMFVINKPGITQDSIVFWDPITNVVTKLNNPNILRDNGPILVLLGEKIYAIGGSNQYPNAVESYDLITGEWTIKQSTNRDPLGAGACAVNNHIFIMGGSFSTDSVEAYDVSENRWYSVSPTPKSTSYDVCYVVDQKIYLFGDQNGFIYDPVIDQWTSHPEMVEPYSGYCLDSFAASVFLDKK